MVPLHDMSVQGLLVLSAVVAALPIAGIPDVFSLAMLLPGVLVEEMFIAGTFVTNIADVFLGYMIFHVQEEFLR